MSDVLTRIALAAVATLVATGLAIQLRAHDLFASANHHASGSHLSRAQVDDVLHDFERVSQVRPGTEALLAAAALELRLARYASAERNALHALRREPDNFAAWATLGVARQAAGDMDAGAAALARAHALNPLYQLPR